MIIFKITKMNIKSSKYRKKILNLFFMCKFKKDYMLNYCDEYTNH
jgi:hypothetical protein